MPKYTLLLVAFTLSTAAIAGAPFSIHCVKTGDLMLLRSETTLKAVGGGLYEAAYVNEYEKLGKREYTMTGLRCEFEKPAVHCWNKKGQAFNFSEERVSKFTFDHHGPDKFKKATEVEYNTTFMFHPNPWAETGPDAAKYQHMPYPAGTCIE